ncbi:hypothetical protein VE03_03826 [Pseudogymnoascus sp. 23342-1-I1]|nr:hypothetical protein VE03_03826 [Pseudogymnoascus sp. 23342-1-I1]
MRVRMVPVAQFSRMIEEGERIGIAACITHILRNDHLAEGGNPSGAAYLNPDLHTVSMLPCPDSRHQLQILAGFVRQDGIPIPECPRQKLVDLTDVLDDKYGVYVLVGYEIEVVFLSDHDQQADDTSPETNHSWSAITSDVRAKLPMVEDIVRNLLKAQVPIQQYHAEAAPGQWEIVLPPKRPLEAVDTLIRAREIISLVAQSHGYRATLHPRPYSDHAGTGAHVHLSVNPIERSQCGIVNAPNTDPFFAGILSHFPSLMAFCLPLDVSYERAVSGIWSGGEYVSWGWQNRETALRRIALNRFELKLHCGTANPYVSLAAILAAGIDGLQKGTPLTAGDCQGVPTEMTEEQRTAMGISMKIPRNLEASLEHLQVDTSLRQGLGEAYVAAYVAVTKEWNEHVSKMDPDYRRRWLLQTY